MNTVIKDALTKGKFLREELDKKTEEEAKKRENQLKAAADQKEAELQAEAERCLFRIPDRLTEAVATRQQSFSIMSYENDKNDRFSDLAKLLEPKLKKMGLQTKQTTSTHWVQMTYDPDTGYDATWYHLEIVVPDEGL